MNRLHEETLPQSDASQLEARFLNNLLGSINQQFDTESVLRTFFENLSQLTSLDTMAVVIIDKESATIHAPHFCLPSHVDDAARVFTENFHYPFSEDSGSLHKTYLRKKRLYIKRFDETILKAELDRNIVQAFKFQDFLHVPLKINDEVIGILFGCRYAGVMHLSKEELGLVDRFCQVLTIILNLNLSNDKLSRANQDLLRQASYLKEMQRLSKSVQDNYSFEQMIKVLQSSVYENYGLDCFNLYIVENEEYCAFHDFYVQKPLPGPVYSDVQRRRISLQSTTGLYSLVYRKQRGVYFPRLKKVSTEPNEDLNVNQLQGTALMAIPLMQAGSVYAILTFYDIGAEFREESPKGSVSKLTKPERLQIIELTKMIGPPLYVALQKEKLVATEKRLVLKQASLDRITALSEIINKESNISDLFKTFYELIKEHYKLDNFSVYLTDKREQYLYLFKNINSGLVKDSVLEQFRNQRIYLNEDQSLHVLVYKRQKALWLKSLRDQSSGESEDKNRKLLGLRALFLIPMKIKNQAFGCLNFADADLTFHHKESTESVKNLSKTERQEITQLVSLVSTSIYQNLQKNELLKSNEMIYKQKEHIQYIQRLSKNILNKTNFTQIRDRLKKTLREQFNINSFIFYIYEKENSILRVQHMEFESDISTALYNRVQHKVLDLKHSHSIHARLLNRSKSIYLPRLGNFSNSPEENELRSTLGLTSMYMIPFRMDGQLFAVFSMADTKFQQGDRIKNLIKKDREGIELLSDFVAPALFQSMQHLKLKKAEYALIKERSQRERLAKIAQDIQNQVSLEDLLKKLKEVLYSEFDIRFFLIYIVNYEKQTLDCIAFESLDQQESMVRDLVLKNRLPLSTKTCLHGRVAHRSKALHLPRFVTMDHLCKEEVSNANRLQSSSLYITPLTSGDGVYGLLSTADSQLYQKGNTISKLTAAQLKDIGLLSQSVSASLYQNHQKKVIKEANQNLIRQQKLQFKLQEVSQKIQQGVTVSSMLAAFEQTLIREYQVESFILGIVSPETNEVIIWDTSNNLKIHGIKEKLASVSLNDEKSIFSLTYTKSRSLHLKKLRNISTGESEDKNRKLTGMESMFTIPCVFDNQVFAILALADVSPMLCQDPANRGVQAMTKQIRVEIEQIVNLVSFALYQALQKEKIEQAQAAASRAKNEAAINQLAAHLAHEVNNPLNYIATGKTMQSDSFSKYHELILGVLTGDDEDSLAFKDELEKLQDKFNRGLEQTNEGQDRIAKVIAEIRAITGVDGLNFTSFDIVPVIKEELAYSLARNKMSSKELMVQETGLEMPIQVLSNTHILARSVRTVISNCIHFAREHKGNEGELYIDCKIVNNLLLIEIGNNSNSIKTKQVQDMFNLEKSKSYGTEQIGLAMIRELLLRINCDLTLADDGRESGKVIFQLQVPLEN